MTQPLVGIVAGSGLDLAEGLGATTAPATDPWFQYRGFFQRTDDSGPYLEGHCEGIPIILVRRRRHFYEGLDYPEVVRPIDYLATRGVRAVILTNAAGGLDPAMRPGHLMAAHTLHTWYFRRWPGRPEQLVLDTRLEGADSTGNYMWMHGPCYETAAEIEALRRMGMQAVGMSTAPEAQRCREHGIATAAVSVITNTAGQAEPLTHDEVERVATQSTQRLLELIRANISRLALTPFQPET